MTREATPTIYLSIAAYCNLPLCLFLHIPNALPTGRTITVIITHSSVALVQLSTVEVRLFTPHDHFSNNRIKQQTDLNNDPVSVINNIIKQVDINKMSVRR